MDRRHQVDVKTYLHLESYLRYCAGKTHTLMGTPEDPGLTILTIHDIFEKMGSSTQTMEYLLKVSYFEIYNESFRDLLSFTDEDGTDLDPSVDLEMFETDKLKLRGSVKTGWYLEGLKERPVKSPDDVLRLLVAGEQHRHVGQTNMNDRSSRSHTIFRMSFESREIDPPHISHSSILNLVDLAGSESQKKTGATGERLKEGMSINTSLLSLGQVINTLSSNKSSAHVPYGDSALTKILATSLGGNAKTAIVACVSPAFVNMIETRNTILFASRAAKIENRVVKNTEQKNSALAAYKDEIAYLKEQLAQAESNSTSNLNDEAASRLHQLQALIVISSEVAKQNQDAGQKVIQNLADVTQGRRRLASVVGETLELQAIYARKSAGSFRPFENIQGRRISKLAMDDLRKISSLKGLHNIPNDPRLDDTFDQGPEDQLDGAMDVAEDAQELYYKFNSLADTLNSDLWGLRSSQKSFSTAEQIAHSTESSALSTRQQRWVRVEELDRTEKRFSEHLSKLLAANEELLTLVDRMRQASNGLSGSASSSKKNPFEAAERLTNLIQTINASTLGTEDIDQMSRVEMAGQLVTHQQQLEVTRALYVNDMHNVLLSREQAKSELLEISEKEAKRADKAESQLRLTGSDVTATQETIDARSDPIAHGISIKTRWVTEH